MQSGGSDVDLSEVTFTLEELHGAEKLTRSVASTSAVKNDEDNYSTRMEDILGADGNADVAANGYEDEDEEDDEEFLYTGDDAPDERGYDAQLAELLNEDAPVPRTADSSLQELHIRAQLIHESDSDIIDYQEYKNAVVTDSSPPLTTTPPSPFPKNLAVPTELPSRPVRPPFLHPSVSRLRSFVPGHRSRVSSSSNLHTSMSYGNSLDPSHFSAISRASSVSGTLDHVNDSIAEYSTSEIASTPLDYFRDVFRWTTLRHISAQIYSPTSLKAAAILEMNMGRPTVIVVGGLVCVGTDTGRTFVFDFRQQFKFVCGSSASVDAGPVTSLALSLDHTFLGVGHAFGHIFLYDLARPQVAARSVAPVEFESIAAGRKDGHLFGSRILHLSFVGARHTAIISSDDAGLAFYQSLGKVLFVEANDVLRILGNYPEEQSHSNSELPPRVAIPRRTRKHNCILAMSSLPIASSPHPTDAFHVIALLTPIKLVIVGLSPEPKTWYRRHRAGDDDSGNASCHGSIAWFPSVAKSSPLPLVHDPIPPRQISNKRANVTPTSELTFPVLAYAWGKTVMLLRVGADQIAVATPHEPSTPKPRTTTTHTLVFQELGEFNLGDNVMAIHWLNGDQIMVLTSSTIDVWDAKTLQLIDSSLSKPTDFASSLMHAANRSLCVPTTSEPGDSLEPSIQVYKGKVFVLGRQSIQVGTLVSWADRVLSLVAAGDFLSAINLVRIYYIGEAPGNKAGLPLDRDAMHEVVGRKLRELMTASAQYVFSEDRMTDETHRSVDGRGVDRTQLFESLVSTVFSACIALNDLDFLFEDLYNSYEENGIGQIYLSRIQEFILNGDLRTIPPRISQALIDYHDGREDFGVVEKIIWHVDPACLDISQVIHVCIQHNLYDALIYVYTRALRDYVSPLVELLGIIRRILHTRRERHFRLGTPDDNEAMVEPLVPNAYKVYPYLGDVLSGLTHPSQEPMPEDESKQAKEDVYSFLFRGHSSVWQGNVVLTSDEENTPEPTYPYLRLLLRFDAEAMLHALDQAFEDSYLNDVDRAISRQHIVNSLMELIRAKDLASNDVTFLRIFIARNIPKYPQFLHLSVNDIRFILVSLVMDSDQSTREDRQLAAEFLLSLYAIEEDPELLALFDVAQFYRILRTRHWHERQWVQLISAFMRDSELSKDELYGGLGDVLAFAARDSRPEAEEEVFDAVSDALPALLVTSPIRTATLIDSKMPALHENATRTLREQGSPQELYYLRSLMQPMQDSDSDAETELTSHILSLGSPSQALPMTSRLRYIELMCGMDETSLLSALEAWPQDYVNLEDVVSICEAGEAYDIVIWAMHRLGRIVDVFDRMETLYESKSLSLAQALVSDGMDNNASATQLVKRLASLGRAVTHISNLHSINIKPQSDLTADEMWFRLLHSQITAVQTVSSAIESAFQNNTECDLLHQLRYLVQETFAALVQQTPSSGLSFPRLFKRLVDASSDVTYGQKAMYTEFRLILGGMLDSYRTEEDVLVITKRLAEQDLFESVAAFTAARKQGRRSYHII